MKLQLDNNNGEFLINFLGKQEYISTFQTKYHENKRGYLTLIKKVVLWLRNSNLTSVTKPHYTRSI